MSDAGFWIVDLLFLLVIIVQGFAVWYFEWKVYEMHRDRFNERAKWRAAKQKAQLKSETKSKGSPAEEILQPIAGGQ